MNKILQIILLLSYAFNACGTNQNEKHEQEASAKISISDKGSKLCSIAGTIGEKETIAMKIVIEDTLIYGYYINEKTSSHYQVNGTINKKTLSFKILGSSFENYQFVTFEGKWLNDTVAEGFCVTDESIKKSPFKLKLQSAEGNLFTSENISHEDCSLQKIYKSKLKPEDMEFADTTCSSIDLSLIRIKSGAENIDNKVNDIIEKSITGNETKYSSLNEFAVKSITPVTDSQDYEELFNDYSTTYYDLGLIFYDLNVLCYALKLDYYQSGAAHGMSNLSYINFDLKTGDTIQLSNLLTSNYKSELGKIAEKIIVGKTPKIVENWDIEPGKLEINDNYAITSQGLIFLYNEYEIGPYALGKVAVFIPYNKMANLIKKDGLLGKYLK